MKFKPLWFALLIISLFFGCQSDKPTTTIPAAPVFPTDSMGLVSLKGVALMEKILASGKIVTLEDNEHTTQQDDEWIADPRNGQCWNRANVAFYYPEVSPDEYANLFVPTLPAYQSLSAQVEAKVAASGAKEKMEPNRYAIHLAGNKIAHMLVNGLVVINSMGVDPIAQAEATYSMLQTLTNCQNGNIAIRYTDDLQNKLTAVKLRETNEAAYIKKRHEINPLVAKAVITDLAACASSLPKAKAILRWGTNHFSPLEGTPITQALVEKYGNQSVFRVVLFGTKEEFVKDLPLYELEGQAMPDLFVICENGFGNEEAIFTPTFVRFREALKTQK